MAKGVKTAGRSALLRKLALLPEAARREIAKAIEQSAEEIAAAQRRQAPKRTGALERSIVVSRGGVVPKYASVGRSGVTEKGDPDLTVIVSAGNDRVRYAHLVEFGTAPHENKGLFEGSQHPGTRPSPFFFPVYRAYRRRVKSRLTRATKKAARSVAAGGGGGE
ncbi:hypothetical protein BV511_03155 [Methylorubrum extorquens]|uniref:HK97-gp10 family putative phage morphogenesis protein n=1 Tax=Methylorubrum extorquens TaxID=408 RepID=UPI00097272C1|nr:HK97-gp10 family putative phage morphogenesis protein [Methylorubrum extorquens]APX83812.1 hypothetical protein BV511_03155 [Methylorubrum extorquens]